jgi:hypothetical protein
MSKHEGCIVSLSYPWRSGCCPARSGQQLKVFKRRSGYGSREKRTGTPYGRTPRCGSLNRWSRTCWPKPKSLRGIEKSHNGYAGVQGFVGRSLLTLSSLTGLLERNRTNQLFLMLNVHIATRKTSPKRHSDQTAGAAAGKRRGSVGGYSTLQQSVKRSK